MRRPAGLLVAAAGLALVGAGAPAWGSGPEGPIEEAAEAARRTPFSARVEVRWVDRGELHTAELGVRSAGGTIRVQGPAGAGGAAPAATVLRGSGVSAAGEASELLAPELERKYDVERVAGPDVAGRETEQLVLRSGGRVRERLAIDRETGLVLRREVYGAEGRPVRVVTVLRLDVAPVPEASSAPAQRPADEPRRLRLKGLTALYRAPEELAGGYRRVAAYRHADVVQLLYSDGLHGLSLFSQRGELASRRLPAGGQVVPVGRHTGVRYTWPGGELLTWQVGSMVHTLVGDGSVDDLLAAARSVPRPGRPSVLARLRGTCRTVAELVSGGR